MSINRRDFIKFASLVAASFFIPSKAEAGQLSIDEKIFYNKIKIGKDKKLVGKSTGKVMLEIGRSFINTPYVADTLDNTGEEKLVTNLHGLDCWTFFENTLVISRVLKKGKFSFEDYKKELEFVRYRHGIRKKYTSRLHYFIDWLYDNSKKNVVKDINKELGGVKFKKKINFMSQHRESYQPLSSDISFKEIKDIEQNINSRDYYYIPTEYLPHVEKYIHDGDIFGFVANIEGLDTTHTGILFNKKNFIHTLDAASSVGYVSICDETLYDYLSRTGKPGIFIARPI